MPTSLGCTYCSYLYENKEHTFSTIDNWAGAEEWGGGGGGVAVEL